MIDVHCFSCYLNLEARRCNRVINDLTCLLNQAIIIEELQLHCVLLELEHLDLDIIIQRDQCASQDLLHLYHHGPVKFVDIRQSGLLN